MDIRICLWWFGKNGITWAECGTSRLFGKEAARFICILKFITLLIQQKDDFCIFLSYFCWIRRVITFLIVNLGIGHRLGFVKGIYRFERRFLAVEVSRMDLVVFDFGQSLHVLLEMNTLTSSCSYKNELNYMVWLLSYSWGKAAIIARRVLNYSQLTFLVWVLMWLNASTKGFI